jgi:hypothetical protein
MKIKVPATEIENADVEQISLVKHGANRIPWRILKAEDALEEAEGGLMQQIATTFGKNPADVTSQITSVVAREGAEKLDVVMKELGLDTEQVDRVEDLIIYKQDGFDDDATLFALNEDIAVGVSGISKEFMPSYGTDFSENIASQSFYPALGAAVNALMDSVHSSVSKTIHGETPELDKPLHAFSKYVKGLVKNLPTSVFKMDEILSNSGDFERTTIGDNDISKTQNTEDSIVSETLVNEAVAGDLDGLNDTEIAKEEVAEAPVEKAEEVAPVVEATEGEAEVVAKNEDTDAQIVAELKTDADEETDPLKLMANSLKSMTNVLMGLQSTVEKQDAKIDAVAALSKSAVEKADTAADLAGNTVAMTLNDIDESLSGMTPKTPVSKTEETEGSWAGVMPMFDSLDGSGQ